MFPAGSIPGSRPTRSPGAHTPRDGSNEALAHRDRETALCSGTSLRPAGRGRKPTVPRNSSVLWIPQAELGMVPVGLAIDASREFLLDRYIRHWPKPSVGRNLSTPRRDCAKPVFHRCREPNGRSGLHRCGRSCGCQLLRCGRSHGARRQECKHFQRP